MSVDVWQTILSKVANQDIVVRNLRATTSGSELLLLSQKLPADVERVFNLHGEDVRSSNYTFHRYELDEKAYWALSRAAVNVCIHNQDVATLRQLALFMLQEDYTGLLSHVMALMELDSKFNNMHTLEDAIVFYRRLLWVRDEEEAQNINVMPGLTYVYEPREKLTSIKISWSCQILWNWLFGIKYTKIDQLLSMSSFKSLQAVIASIKDRETSNAAPV